MKNKPTETLQVFLYGFIEIKICICKIRSCESYL